MYHTASSWRFNARKTFVKKRYHTRALADSQCSTTVASQSLDDLFVEHDILFCDLVKIDCEGAEYEMLLNTSAATLRRIGTIAMEYHDAMTLWSHSTLVALLEQHGFVVDCTPNPAHREIGFIYARR